MALMTVEAWQKKTSSMLSDRKNPLITDLDILIGQYHSPGKTNLQKLKLLILIRRYCNDWLSEKGDKDKSFRREYVGELRDQTTELLQSADMQAAVQQRMAGGNQTLAGKQMRENVAEVLQPRPNAKEKFGLQADLPMLRLASSMIETAAERNNVDAHDLVAALDVIGDYNQRKAVTRNLEYLQKNDRLKCRLQVWPDTLFHRAGVDSPHNSPEGKEMYAMDQMEFIYTSAMPAKSGTFHHSSFLSGKPVLCAGEITLTNGRITHIDNLSGHYQPTKQNLLNCLRVLSQRYNVNLSACTIIDQSQPQGAWDSAADYLRRNGSAFKMGRK